MKLLLVGATGLVGSHVLRLALADERIRSVVVPTRRPLATHSKLEAPQVNFEQLPSEATWWRANAVICTLGTTMKTAGSRQAFQRVDLDYPLAVARLARQHGTQTFALNSAMGANASSRFFYNRVKGELERELATLGFTSLAYVRPGLIGGEREEARPAERAAGWVLGALGPILPTGWRINPAERIAEALVEAAVEARPGVRVIGSHRLAQ